MKKLAYTVLLSLSALFIAFGLTAVEAPPESVDRTEVAIPAESEAREAEATEVTIEASVEMLVNSDVMPALDPDTSEPIDAAVGVCNCKTGIQPSNPCQAGQSCQACPCLSPSSKLDGVCQ